MKVYKYILIMILFFSISACEDLLENELPADQVRFDEAVLNEQDLQELLNSAYDVNANAYNGKNQRLVELLADNLFIEGNSGNLVQVYNRASDFFNSDVGDYYKNPYETIYRANLVLENVENLNLDEAIENRFKGEAKFLRAISLFELVRLFAQPYGFTQDNTHIGIVIKTNTEIEAANRASVADVYQQIILDLEDAEDLLPMENGNYATTYSASAFLAKVHFQMNDFANAAQYATRVIEEGSFIFSDDINNRFSTDVSSEAVFTVISTGLEDNRASLFTGGYDSRGVEDDNFPTLLVSQDYFNLLKSNTNDLRSNWVEAVGNNRVFTKFNMDYFNVTVTSLTEMMLIAAESYGELDQNLPKAIEYINLIKDRAEVNLLDAGSSAGLVISEARSERRKEFGGEGLRLHELKRRAVKGENILIRNAPWDCDGMVLQFPASEIAIEGFTLNPEGGCN